jgi:cytoskeletal protein RodZ
MDDQQLTFETFFRDRVKEKGLPLKKLADLTGIALTHLENMARGNFDDMPSAPYFHGYIVRLSKVLDFDAEEWWEQIKKENLVKNSGPTDALPRNRFIRKSPAKAIAIFVVILLAAAYLIFQIPRVLGKPAVQLTFPAENPYTAASNTLTLTGTVKNADGLYLNGDPVGVDVANGMWQKSVLLQDGVNTFQITAKKFLGGQTDIVEQVIYQSASGTATSTASSVFPVVHMPPTTPATGSYYQ